MIHFLLHRRTFADILCAMRLDLVLAGKPEIRSRSRAQQLIDAGLVRVNDHTVTKRSMEISPTDVVTWIEPPPPPLPSLSTAQIDLPVLFEDDACMVIAKPAGIVVHPGSSTAGALTILDAVQPLFAARQLPFSPSHILVHRLDKDTTGCLLLAKTPSAHLSLQQQFAKRTVDKQYLVVVDGVVDPPAALIEAPIGRHPVNRVRMSIHRTASVRPASTSYQTLASSSDCTLLRCTLHTGRTHQIRVHLSSIGHPVLGDITYTTQRSQRTTVALGVHGILLHAWILGFHSPLNREEAVIIHCPLPSSFSSFLSERGWLDALAKAES